MADRFAASSSFRSVAQLLLALCLVCGGVGCRLFDTPKDPSAGPSKERTRDQASDDDQEQGQEQARDKDKNKDKGSGEAYQGADAEWGKRYRRKKKGEPAPYFLDEKASQIERSLGL